MFKKYDRVKCFATGKEEHGTVITKKGNKIHVRFDDGRYVEGDYRIFQKSDKKGKSFKKNDRVESKDKDGKMLYGTVIKGGNKKIEVMLDNKEGIITGMPFLFNKTKKELPKDTPTIMDNYSIKNWHEIEGHGDSRTFDADIYHQGKKVIRVSNDGWGGENFYTEYENGSINKLRKDIQTWKEQLGFKFKDDVTELWIEWYKYGKPYGKLAVDELNNYEKLFKKYLEH